MSHSCPTKPREENVVACVPRNEVVAVGEGRQPNAGFTEVRRGGRRAGTVQKPAASVEERLVKESGRNLREIPQKDMVNIAVSNKFGELEIEENEPGVREENIRSASNKENISRRFNGQKEAEGLKIREEKNGLTFVKGKGVQRGGLVEKKAQQSRSVGYGQGAKQIRGNKVGQGLVFGSCSEKMNLTSNEKRLRVESGNAGRPGGAYQAKGNDRLENVRDNKLNGESSEIIELGSEGKAKRVEAEMVDVSPEGDMGNDSK